MTRFLKYWPIVGIYLVSALLALVSIRFQQVPDYMSHFMGFVLVFFGLTKLGDISGFAQGFAQYDSLARKSITYASIYPFLEILLGVLFIGQLFILPATLITLVIYSISLWGAIQSVMKKQELHCVCLGTYFKLPLSTVTMLEATFMIGMCIWMLIMINAMTGMTM